MISPARQFLINRLLRGEKLTMTFSSRWSAERYHRNGKFLRSGPDVRVVREMLNEKLLVQEPPVQNRDLSWTSRLVPASGLKVKEEPHLVAELIRRVEARGVSLKEAGIGIGTSASRIAEYRTGRFQPRLETAERLAMVAGGVLMFIPAELQQEIDERIKEWEKSTQGR